MRPERERPHWTINGDSSESRDGGAAFGLRLRLLVRPDARNADRCPSEPPAGRGKLQAERMCGPKRVGRYHLLVRLRPAAPRVEAAAGGWVETYVSTYVSIRPLRSTVWVTLTCR